MSSCTDEAGISSNAQTWLQKIHREDNRRTYCNRFFPSRDAIFCSYKNGVCNRREWIFHPPFQPFFAFRSCRLKKVPLMTETFSNFSVEAGMRLERMAWKVLLLSFPPIFQWKVQKPTRSHLETRHFFLHCFLFFFWEFLRVSVVVESFNLHV